MSIWVMEEELINLDVIVHNNASYGFHTILLEFCSTNNISSHYTNAHHDISCNKKTKQKVEKYHHIVDKLINVLINYILGLY